MTCELYGIVMMPLVQQCMMVQIRYHRCYLYLPDDILKGKTNYTYGRGELKKKNDQMFSYCATPHVSNNCTYIG